MLGKWIFYSIIFVLFSGIICCLNVELPSYISWVGNLPGDLIVKTDNAIMIFPVTSSTILSLVVQLLFFWK